jgi:hypothetical protein
MLGALMILWPQAIFLPSSVLLEVGPHDDAEKFKDFKESNLTEHPALFRWVCVHRMGPLLFPKGARHQIKKSSFHQSERMHLCSFPGAVITNYDELRGSR